MLSLILLALFAFPVVFCAPPHPQMLSTAVNETTSLDTSAGTKVSAAWYAGWHSEQFPLSKVSWKDYTHMTYAFAVTTPDVKKITVDDETNLHDFVTTAKSKGVKSLLSVGGWTGSQWFSTNVGSSENRTAFVKTVTDYTKNFNLDGLDFDWEYPGREGLECNIVNGKDTANFLSFLKELRSHPDGKNLILTSATSTAPYADAGGDPSKDVSQFAKVLNWVAIMNYDVWGSDAGDIVGPNAPLDDTCAPTADQQGSAVSAVKAWSTAGMPKNQIVLGVASYGHSFHVDTKAAFNSTSPKELAAYPKFDLAKQPTGDKWDGPGTDPCTGKATGPEGVFDYWGLIDSGFLKSDGSPASGITKRFDNCSQTAYVYNKASQVMVSYDDTQAFTAKGSFIKQQGLRGFAMWEAGGDSEDNALLGSIRKAMGV